MHRLVSGMPIFVVRDRVIDLMATGAIAGLSSAELRNARPPGPRCPQDDISVLRALQKSPCGGKCVGS